MILDLIHRVIHDASACRRGRGGGPAGSERYQCGMMHECRVGQGSQNEQENNHDHLNPSPFTFETWGTCKME